LGIPQKDDTEEDPERTGTVSFFNHDKGYGFIKDADNGDSMFVHIKQRFRRNFRRKQSNI